MDPRADLLKRSQEVEKAKAAYDDANKKVNKADSEFYEEADKLPGALKEIKKTPEFQHFQDVLTSAEKARRDAEAKYNAAIQHFYSGLDEQKNFLASQEFAGSAALEKNLQRLLALRQQGFNVVIEQERQSLIATFQSLIATPSSLSSSSVIRSSLGSAPRVRDAEAPDKKEEKNAEEEAINKIYMQRCKIIKKVCTELSSVVESKLDDLSLEKKALRTLAARVIVLAEEGVNDAAKAKEANELYNDYIKRIKANSTIKTEVLAILSSPEFKKSNVEEDKLLAVIIQKTSAHISLPPLDKKEEMTAFIEEKKKSAEVAAVELYQESAPLYAQWDLREIFPPPYALIVERLPIADLKPNGYILTKNDSKDSEWKLYYVDRNSQVHPIIPLNPVLVAELKDKPNIASLGSSQSGTVDFIKTQGTRKYYHFHRPTTERIGQHQDILKIRVIKNILSFSNRQERTMMMEWWINVMNKCVQSKNYHAAFAIHFALNSTQIGRLAATRSYLSKTAQEKNSLNTLPIEAKKRLNQCKDCKGGTPIPLFNDVVSLEIEYANLDSARYQDASVLKKVNEVLDGVRPAIEALRLESLPLASTTDQELEKNRAQLNAELKELFGTRTSKTIGLIEPGVYAFKIGIPSEDQIKIGVLYVQADVVRHEFTTIRYAYINMQGEIVTGKLNSQDLGANKDIILEKLKKKKALAPSDQAPFYKALNLLQDIAHDPDPVIQAMEKDFWPETEALELDSEFRLTS